jgi:hypothetical protein
VGINEGGIDNSYATGIVSAAGIGGIRVAYAGGLVGENVGTISNSHAVGASVSGGSYVGGLAGDSQGSISSSYATDPVSGTQFVGGLVGLLPHAEISNSYTTGAVTGINDIGGLVGEDVQGLLSNAFFNVDQVSVNGSHQLTQGGLYNAQYLDWFTHGETLNIANYSSSLTPGSGGYYNVASLQGLQDLLGFSESNAADNFRLTADISLPPGFSIPYFAGSFDGNGKTLSNLSLNSPNSSLGLFGYLPSTSTMITDVAVSNASVIGESSLGGLVGSDVGATITDSYVSGTVNGDGSIGGQDDVGGLVGAMGGGSIINSYAAGTVSSSSSSGIWVGGLVGAVFGGTVSNSYSTANVTAAQVVGGLVGTNYGTISKSYAAGHVNGTTLIGGGFAGNNAGTITNSFYNSTVNPGLTGLSSYSGSDADIAGVAWGLSSAQMQVQANFSSATAYNGGINPDWDLVNTWIIYEGHTAPLLRSFMTALTVTANNATRVYDDVAYSGGNGLTYPATNVGDGNVFDSAASYSGSSQGAVHVGSYTLDPSGAWSDQQGYILTPVSGSLSITPAPLTVSGTTVVTRAYNGTLTAPLHGGSLVGVVPGDSVSLTQAGLFASNDPGSALAVTAEDSLGGASAGDYSLTEPTGLTGTITPASLTVIGTVVGSKIYNGSTSAPLLDGSLSGVIRGDTVTLIQAGNFASAGVGSGIAVIAADTLAGPSALDYSIIEPSGLTGTISPAASSNAAGTSSSLLLAAYYASAQIDANSFAPRWGATPQVIDASSSIDVVETASEPASTDAGVDQDSTSSSTGGGVVINVAMKIGAIGTLRVENGGLRLPVTHVEGNP